MKKRVLIILLAFGLFFGMSNLYAEPLPVEEFQVPVSADIIAPDVTLTLHGPMSFGEILPDSGASDTVTLDAATLGGSGTNPNAGEGVEAVAGADATVTDPTAARAGTISLLSEQTIDVDVVFADSLTLDDGVEFGDTMDIADIGGASALSSHDGEVANSITLTADELYVIHFGGELTVDAKQPGGTYSGNIVVDVQLP